MSGTEEVIGILLLGDAEVGKSTFLSRIAQGPRPTSENFKVLPDSSQPFVFDIHGRAGAFRLEVSDNDSPESYVLLRPAIIVLCFSVCDRGSLESAQNRWKREVESHFNYDEALPVMLLGLKRDLRAAGPAIGGIHEDHVLPQEAIRVAGEMRCDRYAECSAVSGELCREAWEDLVKLALATRTAGGGKTPGADCTIL